MDEAHHAPAKSYRGVLDNLGSFGRQVSCGFTATMVRADAPEALGSIWEDVVYEKSLAWAISEGYLRPARVRPWSWMTSTSWLRSATWPVTTTRASWRRSWPPAWDSTVEAIMTHAPDRAMIVFATGVDHAGSPSPSLTQRGRLGHGRRREPPREYRQEAYGRFTGGQTPGIGHRSGPSPGSRLPAVRRLP